jgi:asparagine synthase (glutamine-hydrolysing)
MCGIAGFLHSGGRPAGAWRAVLERMTRTLVHRGPDDEGYYLDDRVGLGHRRLSVVDLETGRQPIANETGDVWVVANSEIYNDPQLRPLLEKKGHRFRTRSDSETIAHAYEEWGTACVEHLRGMFAFALWDVRRGRLLLARDRLGKKPLYYAPSAGGALLFGSELKSLLVFPTVDRALCLEAVSDFLSLMYVPRDKSIFRGIRKLLPGQLLIADRGGIRLEQYWQLHFGAVADDPAAPRRLAELLRESVELRLRSDVPYGAFLSGGIDSSTVVGLMAQQSSTPVPTAAIGFAESEFDERAAARRVAAHFGTDHCDEVLQPSAVRVIEALTWHYDEPFGDASAVPTWYLSALTRRRVTVALSGDGGDETFGGYRRYVFDLREHRVRSLLPSRWGRALVGWIGSAYPKADYLPQTLRGKAFLSNVARTPWEAYLYSVSAFKEDEKPQLLSADAREQLGGYRTAALFEQLYTGADGTDPLSRIQHIDFQTYLPDGILTKVDRASMAHGLEVRCPLLDHQLVEFAARLPASRKIDRGRTKILLRDAVCDLLPDEVLRRPKMGFTVPLRPWLRGPLRALVDDLVLNGSHAHGLFATDRVRSLWCQHRSGRRDRTNELWAIAMFNAWYRRFGTGSPVGL